MDFITELIEKLKSGPVMCWTRGGGLIEVEKYNPGNTEPFWADGLTWNIDGKLFNTREDILDLIAICNNHEAIRKMFEQDTMRKPVAGDWVVWIGDNGYLKHNEVLQVESAKGSDFVLKNNEKAHWRWCELFRFAAPEEIAAAQKPKFKIGDVVYWEFRNESKVFEVTEIDVDILNDGEWHTNECYCRHATPEEKAKFYGEISAPPTQLSEQACSTLVMVCRGLETTKGTT